MRIHPLITSLLATAVLAACSADVAPVTYDFEESGMLVRNESGLTPGMWYLRYNADGMEGIAERLSFDEDTICVRGGEKNPCERSVFESGLSVTIRAMEQENNDLLVKEMEIAQ